MFARLMAAALSAALACGLAATAALAQTSSTPGAKSGSVAGVTTTSSTAGIGQNLAFCVASNASAAPTVSLAYPGDNSSLVVDASMSNLVSGDTTSVGFQVFDVANTLTPVETANLATNQMHANPSAIEFAYSSGSAGTVQLRPFNFSPNQVCFTVSPIQLPSGVSSLTLNGAAAVGQPAASVSPRPSASPAPLPSTPVVSKSAAIGQSLSFCLAPNASSAPVLNLSYPGDNTALVLDSSITGLAVGDTTGAGFMVFEGPKALTPVETANLSNNEFNGNPRLIRFAYSSATSGQVQIRPFNSTTNQVCFDVSPVQLPSGVGAVSLV
jgi:hypothetical protein